MIRSMTGYGGATVDSEALQAAVTVRSVNHRYLDLSLSLPRPLQGLEGDVKRLVQTRIHRGRVELHVSARLCKEGACVVPGPRSYVASLVEALRTLQEEHGLAGEVRMSDVARFPGVLEIVEPAAPPSEETGRDLLGGVSQALAELEKMRVHEGECLSATLVDILGLIEAAADRIASLWEGERGSRVAVLMEKLRALREELSLEETRLYQDVVRFVERLDVAEELVRIRSHVVQARGMLGRSGACGKPLDFLAQEMAREAATIGSKSASAAITQEVVALKAEVERLREQVQNVE